MLIVVERRETFHYYYPMGVHPPGDLTVTYILLITHYFGAAWQVPWGCLAVIVVVVLAAVVLAVYNPVRRILMQPITATISEL